MSERSFSIRPFCARRHFLQTSAFGKFLTVLLLYSMLHATHHLLLGRSYIKLAELVYSKLHWAHLSHVNYRLDNLKLVQVRSFQFLRNRLLAELGRQPRAAKTAAKNSNKSPLIDVRPRVFITQHHSLFFGLLWDCRPAAGRNQVEARFDHVTDERLEAARAATGLTRAEYVLPVAFQLSTHSTTEVEYNNINKNNNWFTLKSNQPLLAAGFCSGTSQGHVDWSTLSSEGLPRNAKVYSAGTVRDFVYCMSSQVTESTATLRHWRDGESSGNRLRS